ncbi:MAG TPA: hypothetical protein VF067_06560 [Sphingomicrobium sp.]
MRIATTLAALAILILASNAVAQSRLIEQAGPFVHVGTNTTFPEQFGDFARARIVRYEDPAGEDISAGYGLAVPGARIAFTQYIYPAPAPTAQLTRELLCRDEFDGSAAEIDRHDNAHRLGEPAAPAVSGVPSGLSHRASYTFSLDLNGNPTTLQSQIVLYCYVGGNWFVKYRASSVPGVDLDGALSRFITTGPWPGKKF